MVAKVAGTEIYYEQTGPKPRLLMLHGNGESTKVFSRVRPYLEPHMDILLLDSRGHGQSPWEGEKLTIRQMAKDIACFLEQLGIEHMNVLGFSDGGNIALSLALIAPQKVEKLILAGANLFPAGLIPQARAEDKEKYDALCATKNRSRDEEYALALLDLMVNQPDLTAEEIGAISCPALVLVGDSDLILPEHSALIAGSLPQGRLETITDCDHFMFYRKPEETAQKIMAFL